MERKPHINQMLEKNNNIWWEEPGLIWQEIVHVSGSEKIDTYMKINIYTLYYYIMYLGTINLCGQR